MDTKDNCFPATCFHPIGLTVCKSRHHST